MEDLRLQREKKNRRKKEDRVIKNAIEKASKHRQRQINKRLSDAEYEELEMNLEENELSQED